VAPGVVVPAACGVSCVTTVVTVDLLLLDAPQPPSTTTQARLATTSALPLLVTSGHFHRRFELSNPAVGDAGLEPAPDAHVTRDRPRLLTLGDLR
jgi:hypothetical protein